VPGFVFALAFALAGCSGAPGAPGGDGGASGQGGEAGGPPQPEVSVELGVPGGDDGLDFVPLAEGAELRLQTFGQGGTHVLVAVRCTGCASRAFVSATLLNLSTGVEVQEPPPVRPQLLYCDDGRCDLVPYLVHASGLTASNEEKDGLGVRLTARVRSEAGQIAECSREAVLSTADL